ncbi:MAG: hypothetical protein V7637_4135, partial [Mycobacteriales bacterium]
MRVGRTGRLLLGLAVVAVAVGPAAARPAAVRPGAVRLAVPVPGASLAGRGGAGVLSVLQLNLCNSGMAGCYRGGRSVPEAAAVIAAVHPDAVTLDEICRQNLTPLAAAMRQAFPGGVTASHFQAVHDRDDSLSSCVDGDQYGIGIIVHLPAGSPGPAFGGGEYPGQDGHHGERRVWECLYVIGSHYVCATHLSAFDRDRALAQCRYLMNTAIPATQA